MKRLPFLGLLFVLLCLTSCWQIGAERLLSQADKQVEVNVDSVNTLLSRMMLTLQGGDYVYAKKDNARGVVAYRRALQLKESPKIAFSLGIAMALIHHDSASYYMNRSVELALQQGDTSKVVHYLRNYAQLQAYVSTNFTEAIAAIQRMEKLTDDVDQLLMGEMVKTEAFLKMGQLDSAQYYLDKGKEITAGEAKFPTHENMISHYQAIIDYSSHRTFDILNTMRSNYSVSAGLMYRMLDNKLSLSLNVNDIFVSSNKIEAISNNMKMTADNKYSFTNVRIGVSYTFGGDIRSMGQRNSNGDIQQRL